MLRNFLKASEILSFGLKRAFSDKPQMLKEQVVVMCKDSKHILCYHPEPEHPFEFTKPIERKIQSDSVFSPELIHDIARRLENRPARNGREHWLDALRLAKTFHEHPIRFKRANRNERIKKYQEKVNPIKKNRESI